jgi:hypothetical protein
MTDEIISCHVCRHTFVDRGRQSDLNGNFCSLPCQAWYDAGNAPVAAEIIYRWGDKPLQKSADGFKIACAHCRKDFDSKGLRCCLVECERAYRQREENLAVMAEAGIEPKAKRRCECCDGVIPAWRKGRRVSSKTRFCSANCSSKSRSRVVRPAA